MIHTKWFAIIVLLAIHTVMAQPATAPAKPADVTVLLNLPITGADETKIDYAKLPVLHGEHAVISAGDPEWKFQLHNYLIHHDGRFFCMWSRGPGEDMPSQYIAYATSADGLTWSKIKTLVPSPPPDYAYIARGFWLRDGELLALVAHYRGRGAFGVNKELKLEAYAWDGKDESWKFKGLVFDNAINNFAPEKLPTGEWMTTRREARFFTSMLIGGVKALDDWRVVPLLNNRKTGKFSPDEPIWWLNPDKTLVALYRDNGGSSRLFRSTSTDNAATWTPAVLTNFPNSTSKMFSMATSTGLRLLISNANPAVGRRQLFVSMSEDGLVFNRMALLDIPFTRPSTFQYPHAIEHDGQLLIAFSRTKNSIEMVRIPLKDAETLRGK